MSAKPEFNEIEILERYGIRVTDSEFFDIDESNPHWPEIQQWLSERGSRFNSLRTEFTQREIEQAQWLVLWAVGHYGYPQPDRDHAGYMKATYDLTDHCEKCGIGL